MIDTCAFCELFAQMTILCSSLTVAQTVLRYVGHSKSGKLVNSAIKYQVKVFVIHSPIVKISF